MRKKFPLILVISLIVLCSFNLLMISSLEPSLLTKQIISWILGIILFFIGLQIDPKQSQPYRWPIFIFACIFLALPIILGNITRGSHRWINIGPLTLQSSEIMKAPLMLFLSTTSQPLFLIIPILIVLIQPDLGSAITIFVLMLPAIFYNRKVLKISLILGLFLILLSPLAYRFVLRDYQKQRIVNFLNPNADPLGQGYNLIQSQIAIGSGGLFGKGYRQGSQAQLLFLPEKHTDFIFAATTEELGFLAITIIILAYFFIIKTLLEKAFNTHNNLPLFIFTLGIAVEIWLQSFINIGMNLGLLPVTGIPLPFMSVGGSSIMSLLFSLGIIYSA